MQHGCIAGTAYMVAQLVNKVFEITASPIERLLVEAYVTSAVNIDHDHGADDIHARSLIFSAGGQQGSLATQSGAYNDWLAWQRLQYGMNVIRQCGQRVVFIPATIAMTAQVE